MFVQRRYLSAAIFLFFVEVGIAIYVRDQFIRPYGGDVLVVIFLYCLLKAFLKISFQKALFGVLLFAFFVEGLQLLDLPERLGLAENKLVSTVLGTDFAWLDLLMYLVGGAFVYAGEAITSRFYKR